MLDDFGIEIGTSFGPLHGKVWRIGTMGYNARRDTVLIDPGGARGGAARRGVPRADRRRHRGRASTPTGAAA